MPAWRLPRTELVMLPLRGFLAVVFLYGGIYKIADRRFLEGSSPQSMHASVVAAQQNSPIGDLLGPVADHSYAFGLLMAFAELAVGLGLLLGLLTRIAAAGGMLLALSLWLTVSWQAEPWFTSADVVYLFAFTPLLLGGAGALSLDAWLARARERHPGAADDRTRRTVLTAGVALLGAVVAGGASLFRRSATPAVASPPHTGLPLAQVTDIPVGGAKQVQDPTSGRTDWVLQLQAGRFTAYDATCPHQGCPVGFVSAADGFACPCHGSRFDAGGRRLSGPAPRGLTPIPVTVSGGEVRSV